MYNQHFLARMSSVCVWGGGDCNQSLPPFTLATSEVALGGRGGVLTLHIQAYSTRACSWNCHRATAGRVLTWLHGWKKKSRLAHIVPAVFAAVHRHDRTELPPACQNETPITLAHKSTPLACATFVVPPFVLPTHAPLQPPQPAPHGVCPN